MSYIEDSLLLLKRYCEKEDFRGWDPFDGLNSAFIRILPFKDFKIFKLFWIQLFKNSPINLRRFFLVPTGYNPKGLALFLASYINLSKADNFAVYRERTDYLIEKLLNLRSKGYQEYCWGYNFDWQSRTFFIPKFTPNVIVSTFVGNAFLDLYELTHNAEHLKIADSVCHFIISNLNRSYNGDVFCFSYTPLDKSKIFNASLLASAFLSRVYYFTDNPLLKEEAKKSVDFCVRHQNANGSWFYGLDSNQSWIDSFHTGYNLEALYEYQKYTGDRSYQDNFGKGLNYYLSNLVTRDGIPKYYSNSIYPIDVHSASAAVIFLIRTGFFKEKAALINNILKWLIHNMQDEEGYFYYQRRKYYNIKTPYIRWSCAWMLYALSYFIYHEKNSGNT